MGNMFKWLADEQIKKGEKTKEIMEEMMQESPKEKSKEHNQLSGYEKLGVEIGRLVSKKQKAYGDSFGRSGEVLRQLYPNGIDPDDYDDILTITRILDKLFRIAKDKTAFGESPFRDICGYALLGLARNNKKSS